MDYLTQVRIGEYYEILLHFIACATKKQSAEKHTEEKHTAHKHSAEKHTAKKQLRKISIQQKSIHQKSIQHKSRWVKKAAAFQNQFPLQIFIFKNNLNDL